MGKRWSQKEIEYLHKYYPSYQKEKLLNILEGRTWRAISGKARRLGLECKRPKRKIQYYSKSFKLGSYGEKLARTFLEREGFKLYEFPKTEQDLNKVLKAFSKKIAENLRKLYNISQTMRFTPDYIARKNGNPFIIEVKVEQSTLYKSQRLLLLEASKYGITPLILNITLTLSVYRD